MVPLGDGRTPRKEQGTSASSMGLKCLCEWHPRLLTGQIQVSRMYYNVPDNCFSGIFYEDFTRNNGTSSPRIPFRRPGPPPTRQEEALPRVRPERERLGQCTAILWSQLKLARWMSGKGVAPRGNHAVRQGRPVRQAKPVLGYALRPTRPSRLVNLSID